MSQTKKLGQKDPFTIENFLKQIVEKGISSSNLYSFEIQSSEALKAYVKNNIGARYGQADGVDPLSGGITKLNMLCNEIQIPGVDMTASDVKSPFKGLTQKMVSGKVYNELDIQFYCDLNSTPLSFFRAWQDMIMGNHHQQDLKKEPTMEEFGAYEKESKYHESNNNKAYVQQYYNDYTANIIINKLEKYGLAEKSTKDKPREKKYDVSFKATLNNAYPYSMSSVPYSAGQSELVRVSVGFYYEYQTFTFQPPAS